MIIGTITIITLLLGGGGMIDHTSALELLTDASPLVEEHVADPVRAAAAEEILDSMRNGLTYASKEIMGYQEKFVALDRNYDAEKADFDKLFAEVNQVWDVAEQDLLDGYMRLRGEVTPEEWSVIYEELKKKLK